MRKQIADRRQFSFARRVLAAFAAALLPAAVALCAARPALTQTESKLKQRVGRGSDANAGDGGATRDANDPDKDRDKKADDRGDKRRREQDASSRAKQAKERREKARAEEARRAVKRGARAAARRKGGAAPVRPDFGSELEVAFDTNIAADVFLNGKRLGTTGDQRRLVARVPPGSYLVAVGRTGYYGQSRIIRITENERVFTFQLREAKPAMVAAASSPPSAQQPRVAAAALVRPRNVPVSRTNNGAPRSSNSAPDNAATNNAAAGDAAAKATEIAMLIDRLGESSRGDNNPSSAEWQKAFDAGKPLLDANPNSPVLKAYVSFARGKIEQARGAHAEALLAFSFAATVKPNFALAYHELGGAYLATNRPAEARRAYERALQIDPNLALAAKGLGDVALRYGREAEATAYYERARALGCASSEIELYLVRRSIVRRKFKEALKDLNSIIENAPSAEAHILVGDCYVGLQQPVSAVEAYRKAIALDDGFAVAHFKLGEVLLSLNEYAAARDALERTLALDPNGSQIDRARARRLANKAAAKLT